MSILLAAALLTGTVISANSYSAGSIAKAAVGNGNEVKISFADDGKVFSVDNPKIASYYNSYEPGYSENFYGSDEYATSSVVLNWEGNGDYYQVYVSDEKHFVNTEKYQTATPSLTIDNIIPNRKYYWKVKSTAADGTQSFSDVYTFTPTAFVRTLKIDGVENMRDLGGLKTSDGKTIRYGIIYRSANLDSITEKGKEQIKRLGIKTDIDLRGASSEISPIGGNVKRLNFNAPYYVDETDVSGVEAGINGAESYKSEFVREIKACADPENYPMDIHCAIGRDRTGTLAAMLYAISGVERYDIVREYELSWFSKTASNNPYIKISAINKLCNFIESQSGETFKDKACNYLLSLGVTQTELDSVRNILTGVTEIEDKTTVDFSSGESGEDLPIFEDGNFGYSGEKTPFSVYDGSVVTALGESEAKAAGVPEGYVGSVLKITPTETTSAKYQFDALIDFSAQKLNRSSIEGISMRVYVASTEKDNSKHPEVRIPTHNNTGDWILRANVSALTDRWTTITLDSDNIDALCSYGGGYLTKFDLALRSEQATTMYIDDITVTKKSLSDNEPPVITVAAENIKTTEKTYPAGDLFDITDNSGSYDVTYKWSKGSLDTKGRLTLGVHECTVTATDSCGNIATKKVTYTVEAEPETVLYKITFKSGVGDDITVTYADGEAKDEITPQVPYKKYYDGVWENFTLEKTDDQIVNAKYTPITYTVTFKADGKIIGTAEYTVENTDITEPRVPKKEGYTGKWSGYTLNGGDKTVNAIYTSVTDPGKESTSETESIHESEKESDPESNKQSAPESEPSDKKGCGSGIGAACLSLSALAALAAVWVLKRKKNN